MWAFRVAVLCVAAAAATTCGGTPDAGDHDPTGQPLVFAAASLRTALDEIAPVCQSSMDAGFTASFAGTSALARQIEAGAPADVFISADIDWMDAVEAGGFIDAATRGDLLTNRLVLVAPARGGMTAPASGVTAPDVSIEPGVNLAGALGDGRLAVADPEVVPAGKYAKAALTTLGAWDEVAGRLAPSENVRAALLLVSRGEAPLGIVYRTDAAADPGVGVIGTFPPETHPPIVYPAALTSRSGRHPGAQAVLDCLQRADARAVFDRWGFGQPE
jgi:molybdate transport system substrate-binding protein